jgi:hypothetical protein
MISSTIASRYTIDVQIALPAPGIMDKRKSLEHQNSFQQLNEAPAPLFIQWRASLSFSYSVNTLNKQTSLL